MPFPSDTFEGESELEALRSENKRLVTRQQELLQTIAKLSQDIPYAEEANAKATLIAEVGTLRARVAELERDRAPTMFHIGAQKWPGISKLMEECGEVLQVCGKLIATKGDVRHWDGGPPLDERLVEELADLDAAISFAVNYNLNESQQQRFMDRSREKIERFMRWHADEGRLIFERLNAPGGPISDVTPRTLSCGCSALDHPDRLATSADVDFTIGAASCTLLWPHQPGRRRP